MKIIALGDTHGRDTWKKIINQEEDADKIVFIGDYFDSFDIAAATQMENFADIVAYKKANMDKVVLLIGNHDYHYMKIGRQLSEHYSGFQEGFSHLFNRQLEEALSENLLQMAWGHDKYLFTHAGVSYTWCKANGIVTEVAVAEQINVLFAVNPGAFKFTTGRRFSQTGDEPCQTPIWIRPASLHRDGLENYTHVVGHTRHNEITFKQNIFFIDVLDNREQYLKIVDGVTSTPIIEYED